MNEIISLAFSANPENTSAVLTVSTQEGQQTSFPISSATGGSEETAFFSEINDAIAAYRASKGF